ncbi:unnamed protein product [Caenorhabditis auriculariae]|uniref:Uncharacterized protein n=1 Tax=Caenorhabditis auriculariae TaxID=2777116 RepID=A0A8S1HJN2_9PELO|nr:unnamed protein product [Caenorhabditis auriculariae]
MRSLWEIKSITCRKKRICILVVILSCCSAVVSAGDDCCKRSMWAYPSGNAIPPECELLNCTEGSIHIENPNPSHPLVLDFLSRATKTGSITIINGPYFGINNTNLEEIVHNGPGPAIHLKDSGLDAMTAFPNLSRITVKDPLRYCENWDLLVLDEPNDQGSWDWLVTIANETLKVCNNPTTTTAAFSSTSQKPVAFEPASNATKLDEKAEKRPKSCVDSKILIALVVAMVVLLLAFLLVFSFALVLFISRRRQNAKIASQLSYATQIMNLMINVQAGRDRIILETVNSDAVQVIAQKLVRKVGSWQTMTSTRLSKIKADQPLDPQKDFNFPEGKSLRTQDVLAICAPRQQTAEYTEALDKYETILKAHKAGRKYYEAPKDTSRISETRQSNKKLAKVLKKLEPRRQPAVPPKNRPKAGEDLVEKKKIDPLVKPIESVNKEKCKPLVLSTEPGFRAKFDPNYKALHDNMTILGLLCDQMQNFVEVHGEVLTVVKTVVEQTAAWNVARALDYAQKDRKYLAGKVRRSPLDIRDATGKIASQAVLDPTMFHNDFVELLEKCPPEDKKLLGMLEEENKNRALRLAAAGKNYALYHNVRTKLGDAVLPGETLADANKRHYYEQTRLREIASLVDERYHRNLPNQRPKKRFERSPQEDKEIGRQGQKMKN